MTTLVTMVWAVDWWTFGLGAVVGSAFSVVVIGGLAFRAGRRYQSTRARIRRKALRIVRFPVGAEVHRHVMPHSKWS
jgi:hypothetical protein